MRAAFQLGFRVHMRVLHKGIRRTHLLVLAPALTLVLAAGCGSNRTAQQGASGTALDLFRLLTILR